MPFTLSTREILFRLAAAFIAGMLVGFERESHGRAAGFRTTPLVCVASALAMILSESIFLQTADTHATWRPDPARLAAGILTGIGFLGAGCIIRQENAVRGVTTAATLWFMTVLGLTFGCGYFSLGMLATAIILFILFILPYFESAIESDWYAKIDLTVSMDGMSPEELARRIETFCVRIKKVEFEYDTVLKQKNIHFGVKCKKGRVFECSQEVVADLMKCSGVTKVKWI